MLLFFFSIESGSSDSPPSVKRPSPSPNKPTDLGEGQKTSDTQWIICNFLFHLNHVVSESLCVILSITEYVAMYTYESSEQGDLTFQQGDVITVTKKEGDWWTGTVGGKTGVFPSNYVKPKDSEVMA